MQHYGVIIRSCQNMLMWENIWYRLSEKHKLQNNLFSVMSLF